MEITKQTVLDFYEGFFNQQLVTKADPLIAEDYIQHNPGVEQGREGLVRAFQQKFASTEYFHLEVDHVVLEAEYAAVFLRSVDEQQQTKAHVVDLYRIADGQFVEHWDYFDRRK
ncbi:ester cyclase [uncultured Trichococcus sp.]|uniref:nuclear transport factor 2 family protein n=1 Tax=uncultured Trichococcus sp. TaxID=189665 RepID=UPI002A187133|nr:ester cyclase [uncultured Trichococcus sp.]